MRFDGEWSSDVCSSDLTMYAGYIVRERPALSAGVAQSGVYGAANTGLGEQPSATKGIFKVGESGDPNRPYTVNPASAAILSSWAETFNMVRGAVLGGIAPGEAPLDWATPATSALAAWIARAAGSFGTVKANESVLDTIIGQIPPPRPVSLL